MHPINLLLGEFSRAEQRVLQAIFKAIAEGSGRCVATLEMLARDSNTGKSTTRNAIARAVAIGLLEKTERRYLRSLASQHFELWEALAAGAALGFYVPDGLVGARMAGI